MAPRSGLTVSISPNEIVFPNAAIGIETRSPLDPESAQGGITVRGTRGAVKLSLGGRRATWSADESITPGHHVLYVRGLVSSTQRAITDELVIPFFVTDSLARPPRTVRVESISRLRVGDGTTQRLPSDRRPEGKFIELMKGAHRQTGAPVALAFDQAGHPVDADRIFERLQTARARKFGKLHPALFARLEKAGPRMRVSVALWLRSEEALAPGEKKERGETKRPSRQSVSERKAIALVTGAFVAKLSDEYGAREVVADPIAPVVYAELTREQIEAVMKVRDVVGAFLYEREGIEDLTESIGIANSDDVHSLGFKGKGVNVAIWENAPDDTTNLSIAASFMASGFSTSDHSRHTHGIVKNTEANKPRGHAPSCTLHSANSKDLDALRWAAIDRGCTVISQSFHRSSEPGSASMSYDDIYKDWLALRWPYPTICQAAGNFFEGDDDNITPPRDEFVNHKGYNGLVVGNHDDTASAMSGSSVFRNPSSTHGDRELPEIAANGTSVTTVGLTKSGTSMASPAVAGCAALIQNVDATLKSWPEGCRAILLAGAKRNIVDNTWWQDVVASVDASDGTGAVDALEATNIAKRRRSRNASGTSRGWDVGTLRSSDIGNNSRTTFSYSVTLAARFLSPRKVKVALAWDSKITMFGLLGLAIPIGSTLTVDLDLQILDSRGVQVGYSGSWDNSYEIAEFVGVPGETYTIKIRRWSGSDDVWYGIAWTVTGGLFFADTTRATLLEQLVSGGRAP
ncbi:MAG: S8 family serine peptidase [Phycisphaerae bacterium]|nr:S8 family serine peptidase [Gemmatimonadaceae bacterium]